MELPPTGDVALVAAGALAGGVVNGLSGTGYGLAALGFWLHAMSPATATPLVAVCSISGHVQALPRIWEGVHWPRLWPFLAAGLIGVPIGTSLLHHVSVQPLKIFVGLLLIVYCSWFGLVKYPPIVKGGGRLADAAVGLTGGVMGGMASLSGPAPTIWIQLRGWNVSEQRGVNQPYNMWVLILVLISAGLAGFLDRTFLVWAVLSLPTTLLGTRLGLLLYGRVDALQFRRILMGLLVVSGVTLIVSAL